PRQPVEIIAHRMKLIDPSRIAHHDAHELELGVKVKLPSERQPQPVDGGVLERRPEVRQSVDHDAIGEHVITYGHAKLGQRDADIGGRAIDDVPVLIANEMNLILRVFQLPLGVVTWIALIVYVLADAVITVE